jgi:hypothetical protein
VIQRAFAGCDGVHVPRGVHGYTSGTAQAVLDYAEPGTRLVFSCGWHITRDGQDVYTWKLKALVSVGARLARLTTDAHPRYHLGRGPEPVVPATHGKEQRLVPAGFAFSSGQRPAARTP